MRIFKLLLPIVLGLAAVTAQSHTMLRASNPANEEVVTASPDEIVLRFSTEVRLTALSVVDGTGQAVDLGSLPADSQQEFALATPDLGAGSYLVSWRAVGADSHVVSGEFQFVIALEQAARL